MKCIMLFDERDYSAAILDHNLADDDALRRLAEYRRQRLPAHALDQPTKHRGRAQACAACRKLLLKAVKGG